MFCSALSSYRVNSFALSILKVLSFACFIFKYHPRVNHVILLWRHSRRILMETTQKYIFSECSGLKVYSKMLT